MADIPPEHVEINGRLFYLRRLRADVAFDALADLTSLVLPIASGLQAGGTVDIGASLAAFCRSLNRSTAQHWRNLVMTPETVAVDNGAGGKKLSIPDRDNLDLETYGELFFHCMRVNFAGPLARWLDRSGVDLASLSARLSGSSATTSPAD